MEAVTWFNCMHSYRGGMWSEEYTDFLIYVFLQAVHVHSLQLVLTPLLNIHIIASTGGILSLIGLKMEPETILVSIS